MTNTPNKVYTIWNQLLEQESILEDRREYEVDQLVHMYELSKEEGVQLHALIQGLFRPGVTVHDDIPEEVYKEYFMDSIYNNWEGFSQSEIIALTIMMFDMQLYFRDQCKLNSDIAVDSVH